ncbi:hypothetical protein [Nocardia jejuensis]|nr:hypothetical protein [Nocardia jejuensis]
MKEATFLFFEAPATELPLPWDEIRRRLADQREKERSQSPTE